MVGHQFTFANLLSQFHISFENRQHTLFCFERANLDNPQKKRNMFKQKTTVTRSPTWCHLPPRGFANSWRAAGRSGFGYRFLGSESKIQIKSSICVSNHDVKSQTLTENHILHPVHVGYRAILHGSRRQWGKWHTFSNVVPTTRWIWVCAIGGATLCPSSQFPFEYEDHVFQIERGTPGGINRRFETSSPSTALDLKHWSHE